MKVLAGIVIGAAIVLLAATAADARTQKPQPILVVQPPMFEVPALQDAIDYWNEVAGRKVVKLGTQRTSNNTYIIAGLDACEGEYVAACAMPRVGVCSIHLDARSAAWVAGIVHELGHCLGLQHGTGVMAPSWPELSPELDRAAFLARMG